MKALDIIDGLTRMGNTEGTGIVETPDNPAEITNWAKQMFGGGCDDMTFSKKLKPNTKYLYVYCEQISSKAVEDCKLEVKYVFTNGGDENILTDTHEIYLYEIE